MIIALAALALGASASLANAQDTASGAQTTDTPPGPPRMGHRPPPCPVVEALDANHDGVIDADEIANAPAALKALDKNGDGKLTQDELRPQRPPNGGGPPPGGEDGPPPGQPPQQ